MFECSPPFSPRTYIRKKNFNMDDDLLDDLGDLNDVMVRCRNIAAAITKLLLPPSSVFIISFSSSFLPPPSLFSRERTTSTDMTTRRVTQTLNQG